MKTKRESGDPQASAGSEAFTVTYIKDFKLYRISCVQLNKIIEIKGNENCRSVLTGRIRI